MNPLLALALNPRVLAAVTIAGALALGWWHYTGLKTDLTAARHRASIAEETARHNAEQIEILVDEKAATVAALERAQAAAAANAERSRREEDAVRSAPPSEDGSVAPLLEALRQRRFSK